jgi:hypothetical protein
MAGLPGRFHPQFRDKNRRDIGKSQSIWTDSKMETPGSRGTWSCPENVASTARVAHAVVEVVRMSAATEHQHTAWDAPCPGWRSSTARTTAAFSSVQSSTQARFELSAHPGRPEPAPGTAERIV